MKSMARVGKEARKRAHKASGQPQPLPSKPRAPDELSGGVVDNPKDELPEAIRYLEEGHARGKVVITVE